MNKAAECKYLTSITIDKEKQWCDESCCLCDEIEDCDFKQLQAKDSECDKLQEDNKKLVNALKKIISVKHHGLIDFDYIKHMAQKALNEVKEVTNE